MSVQSEADRNLDEAKEHIRAAIRALGEIVVNECPGHADYIVDYQSTLGDALHELLKIRDKLHT